MPGKTPFRLNRSGLLLAVISAAFAGQAQAAAGRVEFAIGPVTVVGTDGRTRPAARGIEVDTGDTVRTNGGRAQMRMTDGAFISLQPNTEFGIKDYKFEGKTDGSENAFYSLLKGAMRTVTGVIGRINRNKYLVSTPTATVGIRGTGGLIQVLDDGGTLVHGTSGIWFLANPAGTIDVPAGVSGLAPADPNQPPQETTDVPTSGPAPLPPQEFTQGDEREEDGENVIETEPTPPPAVLMSGSGYALAAFFGDSGIADSDDDVNANATFNSLGQMIDVSLSNGSFYTLGSGGSHADFGTDGILAWGRWVGPVTGDSCGDGCVVNENYNSNQGFHYVVGMPTPSMPTIGTANYTLLGASKPTYVDGLNAPGTLSGSLSVDFGQFTVGVSLNIAMPDNNSFDIGGSAAISRTDPIFSGSSGQGLTATGTDCCVGCSAFLSGFFSGASAERAGLGYHIGTDSGRDVIGAAAFAKQ